MIIDTQKYNIPLYTVFLLGSIVLGFTVALFILRRNKADIMAIVCSAFLNLILVIAFGLGYTYLGGLIKGVKSVGFSGMGGLIGMLAGSFFIYKLFNEPLVMKTYTAVTPLIYAVSKMGCFFAGCCGGIEYHGFGSVTYLGDAEHLRDYPTLPVPMLETISFTIIFIIVMVLFNRLDLKKHVTVCVLMCTIVKAGLDFLRQSHVNQIISMNQIFCILVAITIPVVFYLIPKLKKA